MDREVSVSVSANCLCAYALWAAVGVLLGVSWAIGSDNVGRLAIIACGAAATATIRSYFVAQSRRIRNALQVTGHFRSDREDARVRPMR